MPRFRRSERELAFMTSPDGIRDYALGVSGRADDGSVEGVATARFVRCGLTGLILSDKERKATSESTV
jgi:hypothetical protein